MRLAKNDNASAKRLLYEWDMLRPLLADVSVSRGDPEASEPLLRDLARIEAELSACLERLSEKWIFSVDYLKILGALTTVVGFGSLIAAWIVDHQVFAVWMGKLGSIATFLGGVVFLAEIYRGDGARELIRVGMSELVDIRRFLVFFNQTSRFGREEQRPLTK